MRVSTNVSGKKFTGEQGEALQIYYDNRGEPYREGISLCFEDKGHYLGAFLENREVLELRDFLNTLYPVKAELRT